MRFLGICNGETSSVCLFENGKLIAAASEERFTRIKMDSSFPINAIDWIFKEFDLDFTKIDQIAYSWKKGFPEDLLTHYLNKSSSLALTNTVSHSIYLERIKIELERDQIQYKYMEDWIKKIYPSFKKPIKSFFHHESHAGGVALLSPFKKSSVLTIDGRGDFESLTFYNFDRNKNECLKKVDFCDSSDSLGFFYGRITGLLGFTPCRHEGKITGLAAYGDPKKAMKLMKKMIDLKNGKITAFLGDYYRPFYSNYSKKLIDEINSYSREDIAAAAQKHLEDLVINYLYCLKNKGLLFSENICLNGGVFGNVKLTQKIKDSGLFKNVFVLPQMGDGGLCLGAATLAQHQLGISVSEVLSMNLGVKIHNQSILDDYSNNNNFIILKLDKSEIVSRMCADLENKQVVGFVRDRMEFGPRALCNRSIIFGTSDKTVNDWLNKRMKRNEFMPFAPVIRIEDCKKSFKNFNTADRTLKFMTSTVNCTNEFAKKCPAVTHIDMTARPQVISKISDNLMWLILTKWVKKTGQLSLINTSFNRHEEPIICNEKEALNSLVDGMIDVLYTDNLRIVLR
jgi:carbamoyltransferase